MSTRTTHLPARSGLVFIVGIIIHDKVVDAIEIQFLFVGVDNSLGNHLGVAVLRLDMLVRVEAEIDIAGVHEHRAGSVKVWRFGLGGYGGTASSGRRRARALVVGGCGRKGLARRRLAAYRLGRRARVDTLPGGKGVAGRGGAAVGLGLGDSGALQILVLNVKGAEVDGEDEHHLNAADLDDLAALEGAGLAGLPGRAIDLESVAAFDKEEPFLLLIMEIDEGVLSRNQLTGSEVDVDIIFVVLGILLRGRGVWQTPNVDAKAGDIVSPVLGGDLGVGFHAVLVGLMNTICVVLAGLNDLVAGGKEMLAHASNNLIVVFEVYAGLVG